MKEWPRRIRGAVVMGLTWAVVWAPVAVLVGLILDPDGSMDEMWPAIGSAMLARYAARRQAGATPRG